MVPCNIHCGSRREVGREKEKEKEKEEKKENENKKEKEKEKERNNDVSKRDEQSTRTLKAETTHPGGHARHPALSFSLSGTQYSLSPQSLGFTPF